MATPKPSVEREQTDGSLRDEREKTDRAIAAGRDLKIEYADEVLRHARTEADAVLVQARQKADRLLDRRQNTVTAVRTIAEERRVEDAVVRADRDAADQALELERVENERILARLLPAERGQTDDHLHAERLRSDSALANRDDFLSLVAHDLRDLLSGIVMSASLIAKVAGPGDQAARVAGEVARIHRHTARANRLIGDLVDVASIDAGQMSLVSAPGDVRALLAEAADEFRALAAVKGIELIVESGDEIVAARFDRERLFQVFGNLIGNAIKFSPQGSWVALRVNRAGDHVECSVTDQGPGIPPDQCERVFERFVQVQESDRRGLGLGLFIAKRIVEGHGGQIWAKSTLGEGTSVLFTLPTGDA